MKLKYTIIPFILSLITITGMRIYQFVNIGNSSARVNWDNMETLCVIIALICFAINIIMSFFSKDVPKIFILKKSMLMTYISTFAGLMIITNSISQLTHCISSNDEWIYLLISTFGIISGIIFIILGLCSCKGKNLFEGRRLLTLFPTAWALLNLLNIFFKYHSIPTNMTHVSSSLDVIFTMFFLFAQARLFSGLFNSSTFKKIHYFGFSAVLFIIIHMSYDLLSSLDTGSSLKYDTLMPIFANLFLAVYIVSFIFSLKLDVDVDESNDDDMNLDETPIEEKPQIESSRNIIKNVPEKNNINDNIENKTWGDTTNTPQNKYSFDDTDMNDIDKLIANIKAEMDS